MAVPPCPGCCANKRGAAAITVAAAPVFSILRLIGSVIGVFLPFGRLTIWRPSPFGKRQYQPTAPAARSCGSAFPYGIPGARSYVRAEKLLDQRHEYRSPRVWDVHAEDLTSIHGENLYAISLDRQREPGFVGFTQKRYDPLGVRWQPERSIGVSLEQLAQHAHRPHDGVEGTAELVHHRSFDTIGT